MKFNGVAINDLHFGIKDSRRLYDELSIFKQYIEDHEEIQYLIINGDYFDCKLSVGDPATFYAMSFFNEVLSIIRKRKIIFRIIQGTRSHDLNQLQLFKSYENEIGLNFKIIERVSEEEFDLEDGTKIKFLYVPEEYPENADEYYEEYKKKKYNIMFAHGTFDFVSFPGQIELSKKDSHSAPVFIWIEWKDALENGFASVGHIHGRNVYGKKIYYSGSFTRWSFGERGERGFTAFVYDTETNEYEVKFIDNTVAPLFNVISVRELGIDLEKEDALVIKSALDEFITEKDYLRIDLGGLTPEKINILKEAYSQNPKVKVEVRDAAKQVILNETEKKDFSKWHYITKRELPIDKTIQRFCKEELNTDLPIAKIRKIINEE